MLIRNVKKSDLDIVSKVESLCFPSEEAASYDALAYRIKTFPNSFFVAEIDGQVVGHVNGCCTNEAFICDALFEPEGGHQEDGENQMIFGLAVAPEKQRKGIAGALISALIQEATFAKRKQVVLTCKQGLIKYYEIFGFVNQGVSKSTHGGAVWYDMTYVISADKK